MEIDHIIDIRFCDTAFKEAMEEVGEMVSRDEVDLMRLAVNKDHNLALVNRLLHIEKSALVEEAVGNQKIITYAMAEARKIPLHVLENKVKNAVDGIKDTIGCAIQRNQALYRSGVTTIFLDKLIDSLSDVYSFMTQQEHTSTPGSVAATVIMTPGSTVPPSTDPRSSIERVGSLSNFIVD